MKQGFIHEEKEKRTATDTRTQTSAEISGLASWAFLALLREAGTKAPFLACIMGLLAHITYTLKNVTRSARRSGLRTHRLMLAFVLVRDADMACMRSATKG